jgi:hypothetical protein
VMSSIIILSVFSIISFLLYKRQYLRPKTLYRMGVEYTIR